MIACGSTWQLLIVFALVCRLLQLQIDNKWIIYAMLPDWHLIVAHKMSDQKKSDQKKVFIHSWFNLIFNKEK